MYNENYNRTYDIGDELDIDSQNNIFRINAVNDNFIPNDLNEGDTLLTLHGLDLKVKDFDRYDHGSLIQWIDVYFDGTVEEECEDEQVDLVLDKKLFNFSSNNLTVDGEFKLTIVDPDKDDDPPAEEPPVEEPTQEPEVVIEKEIVYVYETIIKYVEVPTVVPKMGVER